MAYQPKSGPALCKACGAEHPTPCTPDCPVELKRQLMRERLKQLKPEQIAQIALQALLGPDFIVETARITALAELAEENAQKTGVCPRCHQPATAFARGDRGRWTWSCPEGCNP